MDPLANGASTVVEFNLGVQVPGSFGSWSMSRRLPVRDSTTKTQGTMSNKKKLLCVVVSLWLISQVLCVTNAQQPVPATHEDLTDFAIELVHSSHARRAELLAARPNLVNVGLIRQLNGQGNMQFAAGHYSKAEDIYQFTERVATQIGDKGGVATALLNLGSVYYFQGKFDLSIIRYKKAESIFVTLANHLEIGRCRFGLALTYQAQQNPTDALRSFESALKEFEAAGDTNEIINTLAGIGSQHFEQGNYEVAQQTFLKILALRVTGDALVRIADAFYMQHDHSQALSYYNRAIEFYKTHTNHAGMISATTGAGNCYYHQRNFEAALDHYTRSLTLEEALQDQTGIATRQQSIGNTYRSLGDYASALDYYFKSLATAAKAPSQATIPATLGNIGLVRALQGDHAQAVEYFNQSLEAFEANGDQVSMARMSSLIGNARYAQGMFDHALEAYRRSLAIHQSRKDRLNEAHILVGVGTVYLGKKEAGPALESFQQALTIYEALRRNADVADALTKIAAVYRLQNDYAKSLDAAQKAARLARTPDTQWILVHALTEVGRAHRGLNRSPEALLAFEEAIKIQQLLRAAEGTDSSEDAHSGVLPFLGAMETLIAQGHVQKAFERAEDAKSQALFEVLHRGDFKITRGMTAQEQTEETKLAGELISLKLQESRIQDAGNKQDNRAQAIRTRLQETRIALQRFRRRLYTRQPRLRIDRGELPPFRLETLRPVVGKNTALVEYVVSDDRVFAFVVTNDGASLQVKVYPLDRERVELARLVARFREGIETRNDSAVETSRELYEVLLKPAEAQFAEKSKLVIIPDGLLWDVPFEALQSADYALIEKRSISYAISVSVLNEMRKRRASVTNRVVGPPNLLVFGSPKLSECCALERVQALYKGIEFKPELSDVNRLPAIYGSSRSRIYTGAEAKKSRLTSEANGYSVLHVDAPSILDHYVPMYSLTILTPDQRLSDDGLLKLWEVTKLNSNARVVILSNSSVAQRGVQSGNAFIALSWSWFLAGTPSVVLSRWETEAASEMTSEFHRQVKDHSYAEALRAGALRLKRSTTRSHPADWSAFMILGTDASLK